MEQIVASSKVLRTTNYKSFLRLPGNRNQSNAHIKAVRESIRNRPDLIPFNPILVNEHMQIIDGQHRLAVCEELGLPIYYRVGRGLTLMDAQLFNQQQKNWTPLDFAKSYIELGNENYEIYVAAKNEFRFNHEVLMRYLSGATVSTERFKAGGFSVQDVDQAWTHFSWLQDMKAFTDRYNIRTFAFGFYMVCTSPEYDHQKMVLQLQRYGAKNLRDWGKPEQYARNLEDIYNINQRKGKFTRLFGTNITNRQELAYA